jgi:hypothetical protein
MNFAKKSRKKKVKKSDLELIKLFWEAPPEAFFGDEVVAPVIGLSRKKLQCDRWQRKGIIFRKIGGRVLYKKSEVIDFLERFKPSSSTSEYEVKSVKWSINKK